MINRGRAYVSDGGHTSQTPRARDGDLVHGFDDLTHRVHTVVLHSFSHHPHAITRCGQNHTVGGSTMATDRAPDGDPTCPGCLQVEGPPDVIREMQHPVDRRKGVDRAFESRLLAHIIFDGREVSSIRRLDEATQGGDPR